MIAATVPVYLDEHLLVLRSAMLDDVFFIWTRVGVDDPPRVPVTFESEGHETSSLLAAALAARDAGASKGVGRPSSTGIVGAGANANLA